MLIEAPALVGSTEPRLWTPSLRELTPETSYGFAVIDFARDVLGMPLDPWQEWLVIHAGELLEDGRPRFRTVLVLVARQAGKTHLCTVLALYWMFREKWPLTLGMSTMLEYAKEAWDGAVLLAEETPELAADLPKNAVLRGNNDVHMKTVHRTRYKIAAANRRGGRSLRIDRLIIDELREHNTWEAWKAATNAMNARPMGQAWAITNQGDDTSVVLEALRKAALKHAETGDGDPRLGLFEWSAEDDCEVDDPAAIAAANPNVGRGRQHWDDLLGPARRAKDAGGEEEAGFRTEVLCQRVRLLNPAIDPGKWKLCPRLDSGLDAVRSRVATCLDVAPDQMHATLYAAAVLEDGRVGIDVVASWSGPGCTDAVRRELPALIGRVRPQAFGWLPDGPAASLAAVLADRSKQGRRLWPPAGVKVAEIRGELGAVCMGFAELVKAGQLARTDDPLLDSQVTGTQKLKRGDRWVFARSGAVHVDGVYAAAGAAHLARTLPTQVGRPRLITVSD